MMKSDIEETHSKSSVVDASDGTSTQKALLKDELSLPKMSSRNKSSGVSLLTKSFSMPSSLDELMPFDDDNNKSPTCIKTTSESEEKYHDNFLSKRYTKPDNADTLLKSFAADLFQETSRENVHIFKMADKPSALNFSARTEIRETAISEKPSLRTKAMDKLLSFNVEGIRSSTATNIFSETEEIYSDTRRCKKRRNFESKETPSQSFISDACKRISSLEYMSCDCKLKDGSLLEKEKYFRSESMSEIPSDLISIPSEMFTNISIDNESPDHITPSSDTYGEDGLPVSLIHSYSFHTHLHPCCEKSHFLMSSNKNASKGRKRKLEEDEAYSLYTTNDAFIGETSFQDTEYHVMASEYLGTDGLLSPWSRIMDEISDVPSFTEVPQTIFSTSNRMSYDTQTDNACPELAKPPPLCDDSSFSSSSSSMGDYYDDDEDIRQFCLQDMLELQDQVSYKEALENENNERPNSIERNVFSDRNCETPLCQFMLKEVEPFEGYLLMQVQEFFSENPLNASEIMSRQASINSILTSRYFTDEFAQQHGLTVSENGVNRIRNKLEELSENERKDDPVNLSLLYERMKISANVVKTTVRPDAST